ncbi:MULTISPECIES: Fic/DOC family protein [unclassified Halomonas]|uniref:Fic/DOC family protein n=1 Tax=unclassified Halomonas TaxID=2609666 RepID=UPI0009906C2C|nr:MULTISPECIES: Fic family protein [unclassified Halomonas]AQU81283.1 cell filamentation protein Fic [Halomonas sp. 'Soap Lake \
MSRYVVSGSEGDYQPGSENRVLGNLVGITSPTEMNIAETELLEALYIQVFDAFPEMLTFQAICQWHRAWLGNVYRWAGQYRTVDMSKPNIRFASPIQIQRLTKEFEDQCLSRFAELPEMGDEQLVAFLAETHVEFILIHPFREGNGRISRLLLDVMVVKAGAQPLDYSLWNEHKDYYFKAIQAGRDGDYQFIERLIRDVLETQ